MISLFHHVSDFSSSTCVSMFIFHPFYILWNMFISQCMSLTTGSGFRHFENLVYSLISVWYNTMNTKLNAFQVQGQCLFRCCNQVIELPLVARQINWFSVGSGLLQGIWDFSKGGSINNCDSRQCPLAGDVQIGEIGGWEIRIRGVGQISIARPDDIGD